MKREAVASFSLFFWGSQQLDTRLDSREGVKELLLLHSRNAKGREATEQTDRYLFIRLAVGA